MTSEAIGYLIAGALIARSWNVAKRLWLYRGEALPPRFRYQKDLAAWWLDVPPYLVSWVQLSFQWYEPYLAEPSRGSILRYI